MVAVFHPQAALAGSSHRLSLFTFQPGSLQKTAEEARDVDALLAFGPRENDLDYLRGSRRPWVVGEQVVEEGSYIAPDNPHMGRTAARYLLGRLAGEIEGSCRILLPGVLVERRSAQRHT